MIEQSSTSKQQNDLGRPRAQMDSDDEYLVRSPRLSVILQGAYFAIGTWNLFRNKFASLNEWHPKAAIRDVSLCSFGDPQHAERLRSQVNLNDVHGFKDLYRKKRKSFCFQYQRHTISWGSSQSKGAKYTEPRVNSSAISLQSTNSLINVSGCRV
jgi:hypothetical protein